MSEHDPKPVFLPVTFVNTSVVFRRSTELPLRQHPSGSGQPACSLRLGILLLTVICSLLGSINAPAQSVLVPQPKPPVGLEPPVSEPAGTNEVEAGVPAGGPTASVPARARNPLQWGPVTGRVNLVYGLTYGTGILSSTNSNGERTLINSISPGIGLDLGHVWRLDYIPSIMIYSDTNFQNTVNHSASLAGKTTFRDWSLGLSQTCLFTSDPSRETGTQTDEQSYVTLINAAYQISGDWSLELNLHQNLQFASGEGLQNSKDWSMLDWLGYQLGPNLSFALGIGAGYVATDAGMTTNFPAPVYAPGTTNLVGAIPDEFANSSDMAYEKLLGRFRFQVTRKINLSVHGGVEFRQFLTRTAPLSFTGFVDGTGTNLVVTGTNTPSKPTLITPLVGGSLAYRAFENTTLTLSLDNSIENSSLQNEVAESTTFDGNLRQRLFKHYYLNVGGGIGLSRYHSGAGNSGKRRHDEFSHFRVSLDTAFLKRGTITVFYAFSDNDSNFDQYDYNSDQCGLQIGFRF